MNDLSSGRLFAGFKDLITGFFFVCDNRVSNRHAHEILFGQWVLLKSGNILVKSGYDLFGMVDLLGKLLQDLINNPAELEKVPEIPRDTITKKEYKAQLKEAKKARKLAKKQAKAQA